MNQAMDVLLQFLNRQTGMALELTPLHFARSRLEPLARSVGLDGLPGLARRIEAGDQALGRSVIEAMATHETYFFRDRAMFTCLEQDILPRLLAARAGEKRLRIWSAACSTGQEPYSIAMLLDECARDLRGWCVDIAASDLSTRAVETARDGRYNRFEVQRGLSAARLLRYFTPLDDDWVIAEHLRERVRFREFNLLDSFASFGPCDIVLCRNLFLYLDDSTTRDVLMRLARILAPDGVLIIGASETLRGLTTDFVARPGQPGVLIRRAVAIEARGASIVAV